MYCVFVDNETNDAVQVQDVTVCGSKVLSIIWLDDTTILTTASQGLVVSENVGFHVYKFRYMSFHCLF